MQRTTVPTLKRPSRAELCWHHIEELSVTYLHNKDRFRSTEDQVLRQSIDISHETCSISGAGMCSGHLRTVRPSLRPKHEHSRVLPMEGSGLWVALSASLHSLVGVVQGIHWVSAVVTAALAAFTVSARPYVCGRLCLDIDVQANNEWTDTKPAKT